MKITPTEAITTALTGQKQGFTVTELRACVPANLQKKIGGTVIRLVKAGVVLKHAGESPHKSRYSLNPDHAPVAAPKATKRTRVQPTPPAPARPAAEEAERFLLTHEGIFVTHSSPTAIAQLMRELRA